MPRTGAGRALAAETAANYDPGPLPWPPRTAPRCWTRCTRSCARYVAFPSAAAAVAVTLWAAHTHLVGQFESTPRLALLSPEKQCGKSRTLELLELVCAGRGNPLGRLARLPVPADRRRAGDDPAR